MIGFKDYITEINIRSIITNVISKLRSLFKGLKFGEKRKVVINTDKYMTEAFDIKSRLGYYSEYVTAYNLANIIKQNKGILKNDSNPNILKKLMNDKLSELKKLKSQLGPKDQKLLDSEIPRMETAGQKLSQAIFEDLRTQGEDYAACEFDIQLTGDLGKGITKADIIVTVRKLSKPEILDKISASLKAYKSKNINLSNTTFVSFFKNLFYENLTTKTTDDFIEKFINDYGNRSQVIELVRLQNIIGNLIDSGKDKDKARQIAKTTHGQVIELMVKIFNDAYKKNKEMVNQKMLHMVGLDDEDDFYAAIGATGKQKIVSLRKSKEMQKLIQDLKSGFILKFSRNKQTTNADMYFINPHNQEIITKGNITFADTGGKKPQGKTNMFFSLGQFAK